MPKRKRTSAQGELSNKPPGSTTLAPELNPVSEQAQVAERPEFDLTSIPRVTNIVREQNTIRYYPANTVEDNELTFIIPKDRYWTNVKGIQMVMEFAPTAPNGGNLGDQEGMRGVIATEDIYHTYFDDQLCHAWWSKLKVDLNSINLPDASQCYYLKAWMHTFLTTNKETQESLGDFTLWERDIHGVTEVPATAIQSRDDIPTGFYHSPSISSSSDSFQPVFSRSQTQGDNKRRWNYFPYRMKKYEVLTWGTARTHQQRAVPKHWLFQQSKCLPPMNELKLTFTRANPATYMLHPSATQPQDVSMKLKSMWLEVPKFDLEAQYNAALMSVFLRTPMVLPILGRMDIRRYNLSKDSTSADQQNIFSGPVPDQLVIGFVESSKIAGVLNATFHDFYHYNVKDLWVERGGKRYPNNTGYTDMGFGDGDPSVNRKALEAYQDFQTLGLKAQNPYVIPVTLREWCNARCTLFYFDITDADSAGGFAPEAVNPVRASSVNIHATFSKALSTAVDMVVLSISNNVMTLTNLGVPHFNFA